MDRNALSSGHSANNSSCNRIWKSVAPCTFDWDWKAKTNWACCIAVLELELISFIHMHRTRVDKVNAELVTLTYGTIVAQLCQDYDSNYQEVNKQLDKMGYNIGMRLIEDFLAKSGVGRCANFRETADMIAKVGTVIRCEVEREKKSSNCWQSN